MLVAVPPAVLLLVLAWWLLTRWIYPVSHDELPGVAKILREQAEDLGRMSRPEQRSSAALGDAGAGRRRAQPGHGHRGQRPGRGGG